VVADERAISVVAGGRPVGTVNGDLEEIVDPKERLLRILSRLHLDYLPSTLGAIAGCANVEIMRYHALSATRVPVFRTKDLEDRYNLPVRRDSCTRATMASCHLRLIQLPWESKFLDSGHPQAFQTRSNKAIYQGL
jgi:hypothetical protein